MKKDTESLRQLYQATILDHNKNPRHFGVLPEYTETIEGYNPLCGDKVTFYLKRVEGKLEAATFECAACAICKASASMLLELAMRDNFCSYKELHATGLGLLDGSQSDAGKAITELDALGGIRSFPSRIACARLAWDTLKPD
ncbi:MAG: SUF system NifU family Fe-S cluster assembly protein [Verrucomicrobia bacterium]|nr:SUF system NifU family Fe-S cluster assembly protein [Verrucomicrobiota bacterium]